MPYRSRYSRRHPSKYSRAKREYKTTDIVVEPERIIADATRTKLTYHNTYATTGCTSSTDISTVMRTFRGNSVYDPDQSGIGNQPTGYDQWTAFYTQYNVLASKIKVSAIATTTDASNPCRDFLAQFILLPSNETVPTVTNPDVLADYPYAVQKFANFSKNMAVLRRYMSTAEFVGLPPADISGDPDYSAGYTSNPINQWYWVIGGCLASSNGQSVDITYKVKLTYYVQFYGRQPLPAS